MPLLFLQKMLYQEKASVAFLLLEVGHPTHPTIIVSLRDNVDDVQHAYLEIYK